MQRQVRDGIEFTVEDTVHSNTNHFYLWLELIEERVNFFLEKLIASWVISREVLIELKVLCLVKISDVVLCQFITNYLFPDSIGETDTERLSCEETECE